MVSASTLCVYLLSYFITLTTCVCLFYSVFFLVFCFNIKLRCQTAALWSVLRNPEPPVARRLRSLSRGQRWKAERLRKRLAALGDYSREKDPAHLPAPPRITGPLLDAGRRQRRPCPAPPAHPTLCICARALIPSMVGQQGISKTKDGEPRLPSVIAPSSPGARCPARAPEDSRGFFWKLYMVGVIWLDERELSTQGQDLKKKNTKKTSKSITVKLVRN